MCHPLDRDERQLLLTYLEGPRIWDAASVYPVVLRLEAKGMIAPVPDRPAYAITAAGRARATNIRAANGVQP